jgi:hypothetical protein
VKGYTYQFEIKKNSLKHGHERYGNDSKSSLFVNYCRGKILNV